TAGVASNPAAMNAANDQAIWDFFEPINPGPECRVALACLMLLSHSTVRRLRSFGTPKTPESTFTILLDNIFSSRTRGLNPGVCGRVRYRKASVIVAGSRTILPSGYAAGAQSRQRRRDWRCAGYSTIRCGGAAVEHRRA